MKDEFLEFSANVLIMYSELVASVLHFKKLIFSHILKRELINLSLGGSWDFLGTLLLVFNAKNKDHSWENFVKT